MEVICHTPHGRFLLRLSRDLNEVVIGNPAKEAGRLDGWRERIRGWRCTAILVSHEEAARSLLKEIEHHRAEKGPRDYCSR